MGRALIEAQRPPMWWIEGGRDGARARFVRFGQQQIAIDDITGMSLEEVREHTGVGLLTGGVFFVLSAGVMAYYVFDAGARERFLLGSAFFAMLGTASLLEARWLPSVSHFELTFTLKDGSRAAFASSDRADIQTLALRLVAEGAPQI